MLQQSYTRVCWGSVDHNKYVLFKSIFDFWHFEVTNRHDVISSQLNVNFQLNPGLIFFMKFSGKMGINFRVFFDETCHNLQKRLLVRGYDASF